MGDILKEVYEDASGVVIFRYGDIGIAFNPKVGAWSAPLDFPPNSKSLYFDESGCLRSIAPAKPSPYISDPFNIENGKLVATKIFPPKGYYSNTVPLEHLLFLPEPLTATIPEGYEQQPESEFVLITHPWQLGVWGVTWKCTNHPPACPVPDIPKGKACPVCGNNEPSLCANCNDPTDGSKLCYACDGE